MIPVCKMLFVTTSHDIPAPRHTSVLYRQYNSYVRAQIPVEFKVPAEDGSRGEKKWTTLLDIWFKTMPKIETENAPIPPCPVIDTTKLLDSIYVKVANNMAVGRSLPRTGGQKQNLANESHAQTPEQYPIAILVGECRHLQFYSLRPCTIAPRCWYFDENVPLQLLSL